MRVVAICNAVLAVVIALPSSANAQQEIRPAAVKQVEIPEAQNLDLVVDFFPYSWLEEMRRACGFVISQRIMDIDRVCGLSVAQKRKLTTGAKGAMERAVSKWRRENRWGPDEAIPDGIPELDMQPVVGWFPNLKSGVVFVQLRLVARESVWVKTLDKVLTTEQKIKLKIFDIAEKLKHKNLETPYRTKGGVI